MADPEHETRLAPHRWTPETAWRSGNPGGLSKAEKRFRTALRKRFIPEATNVLQEMLDTSRDANVDDAVRQRARLDFMKCCGLIPKPSDDAQVESLANKLIDKMLAEAERRADARGAGEAR